MGRGGCREEDLIGVALTGTAARLRARDRAIALLQRSPWLASGARAAYLDVWKRGAALGGLLGAREASVPRVIRVDPARVVTAGVGWTPRTAEACAPAALGGDWDLSVVPIESLAPAAVDTADAQAVVRIGRDGALIAERGMGQLVRARDAGMESFPVLVAARHREWAALRRQALLYARSNGGMLYQPALHPDLADIPAAHSERRYELIRPHLPPAGRILDIGANWGYFCHRFEALGYECRAVERSVLDFYFLTRLRAAEGRHFATLRADIYDVADLVDGGVALALNVFHHFLKSAEAFARLGDLLGRMRAQVMILETHDPSEPQMVGAHRNFGPWEFARFVAERGGYGRCELIGAGGDDDGRVIFRLARA